MEQRMGMIEGGAPTSRWKPLLLLGFSLVVLSLLFGSPAAPLAFVGCGALNLSLLRPLARRGKWAWWTLMAVNVAPVAVIKLRFPGIYTLVPIAACYLTLQAVSFSFDFRRGHIKALPSLTAYLLYLLYLPKLFSPIERFQDFSARVAQGTGAFRSRLVPGLYLVIVGLFKRVVMAALPVSLMQTYFRNAHRETGEATILIIYICTVQFYCGFAGYIDVVRGVSHWLGVRLVRNFSFPALASNPQDFWRRWNTSFSFWLRDYVYYEAFFVGKNITAAVLLTFLSMGLIDGLMFTRDLLGKNTVVGIYCGAITAAYFALKPTLERWRGSLSAPQARLWTITSRILLFHFFCVATILQRFPDLQFFAFPMRTFRNWARPGDSLGLAGALLLLLVPLVILERISWRRAGDEEELTLTDLYLSLGVVVVFSLVNFAVYKPQGGTLLEQANYLFLYGWLPPLPFLCRPNCP